ncbi:protein phosphatase Slingshot homolog 2-like isoform X2 [Acanthaster planci]|uniref:protein-serine/threonine phosphatase n=1 Tax=Acanthaster planci TaxID=133434 RepID=A0A8B7YB77_ACAPL|nr:protein phosphatase Slingshot homolog 2-like isoform X2 [Acanthaster planci]
MSCTLHCRLGLLWDSVSWSGQILLAGILESPPSTCSSFDWWMAVELVIERDIPPLPDECDSEERVKKQCESFFAVKGAALVLPRSNESRPIKKNPIVGELSDHIQSMFLLLRHDDRMTLAVRLESMYEERIRYIILVSCNGVQDTEESVILGMDIMSNTATIGLVLPIWCETTIQLNGDGGFNLCSKSRTHTFKPVSVQALWSAMQAIHSAISSAQTYNYFPGGLNLTWISYYESRVNSSPSRIKEWDLMPELEVTKPHAFTPTYTEDGHYHPSDRELTEQLIFLKIKDIMASADLDNITSREVRLKMEDDLGKSLNEYRHYLDEQLITYMRQMDSATLIFDHIYLGSEWNASHLEELEANGVGYILNVTMEIDNFYPNRFIYHNVRLYDIESSELLKYWDETYKFLSKAKEKGSKALVHCKMGISRSAATVIAYAMKEYNWPLEKARSFVARKRKCVNPNTGFLQQLQVYEGMLDASRQRHNKLWRSKSESSLANSAECSQETIESASSTEDIADRTSKVSEFTHQGNTAGLSLSLGPQTGHARRRSWSPKDSVADVHFPSNVQSLSGHQKPDHLGTSPADVDFMVLDDDCQDIQIIVPESLTPTSPTLTVPTEPVVLGQIEDREPTAPLPGVGDIETGLADSQLESLHLDRVSTEELLSVGESPSGFKEGIPEMTSTPSQPEQAMETEVSPPGGIPEISSESGLNTNNNSATGYSSSQIDDIPPVEGTVKQRVTSFENNKLAPDAEKVEVKSEEESASTVDGLFLEPEIPVNSGTVQKQKQDIEERLRAESAEKGSPPLTRSEKFSQETATSPTVDSTTCESLDTPASNQPKLAEPQDCGKPETVDCDLSSPKSPAISLLQESPTNASPTLQALEKGRVKKITEQLLSQKTPVTEAEEDEEALSLAEKRRSLTFESGSPPQDSPTKLTLSPSKSSPDTRSTEVIETTGLAPKGSTSPDDQSVKDSGSQESLSTEESVHSGSPLKEAFIKTFFGEEIPLEPGTVKRQTIDFEQLSSQSRTEELETKKEAVIKKDTFETPPEMPEKTKAEEMVVIIRDSSSNGKRKFEEVGSQNKHARVDQKEQSTKDEAVGMEPELKMEEENQKEAEINSAYPEEGISSWKVGDVRKHTKQFEGLSSSVDAADQSTKPASPIMTEDTAEARVTTEESTSLREMTEQTSTSSSSGSSEADETVTEVPQVEEDVHVDHGEVGKEEKLNVESIGERIAKLGLNLRRVNSIARMSNEKGSPVVMRRSDPSRPVSIRSMRPYSDTGTRSLESSPESQSQLAKGELTMEETQERRKSAYARLVTPRQDTVPLKFYLEEPLSVEIRSLDSAKEVGKMTMTGTSDGIPVKPSSSVKPDSGEKANKATSRDCQSPKASRKKQQHGKTHPLSKLSPTPAKHPSSGTL